MTPGLNFRLTFNIILFLLIVSLLKPVVIRSDETVIETPDPTIDLSEPATFTPLSTESPTNTTSLTATATFTETVTDIPRATSTPPDTPPPMELVVPSETVTPPTDASVITTTATIDTIEGFPTTDMTLTPSVAETTPSELIETPVTELTDESEATEMATITTTPDETATSTPIPIIPLTSAAHYQSHQPGDSGLQISVTDGNGNLISVTQTDANGAYTIGAPSEEFFWLIVSAPLYKRFELGIWPGETLPEVVLVGGDLDGDGCIGAADLALLTAEFGLNNAPTSDITGDGLTDASDLVV